MSFLALFFNFVRIATPCKSPSSIPMESAARRFSMTACRPRHSSGPPGCAPSCAARRGWASRSTSTTPKSTCRQIHARVKKLAAEQSADIADATAGVGVKLVHGRGELVDPTPGLARHRLRATAPDGSVTEHDADFVLIATGRQPADPAIGPTRRRTHPHLAPALRPEGAARSTSSWSAPVSPAPNSRTPTPSWGCR